MMVPRVYGLLDLAEVIVAPAYDQARAILDSMGQDLGAFVPTASHRQAVKLTIPRDKADPKVNFYVDISKLSHKFKLLRRIVLYV
jgi:hypothetical protein